MKTTNPKDQLTKKGKKKPFTVIGEYCMSEILVLDHVMAKDAVDAVEQYWWGSKDDAGNDYDALALEEEETEQNLVELSREAGSGYEDYTIGNFRRCNTAVVAVLAGHHENLLIRCLMDPKNDHHVVTLDKWNETKRPKMRTRLPWRP